MNYARALGLAEARLVGGGGPAAGDVIEGAGGARKVRLTGKGKGNSGYRVITFYRGGIDIPVFLPNIYCHSRIRQSFCRARAWRIAPTAGRASVSYSHENDMILAVPVRLG